MARYINADALLESLKSKRLIFEESTPVEEAIAEQVSVFEEAIDEAPTVDAVEVVRCKTCYFCVEMQGVIGRCLHCRHWCRDVDGDDYCSYGAGG